MEAFSGAQLLLLLAGGLLAGFVDSIAGGGGIITIPLFLSVGIPPHLALGTNKLQASFGSLTSAFRYRRSGLVSVRRIGLGVLFTFIGALTGTIAIQLISADFLNLVIPFMLLAVFLYLLFSPRLGDNDREARMGEGLFFLIFGLTIGFYDGFFGPGTGSLWAIFLVVLAGYNLKKATAATKVLNFTSNIVALAAFLFGGNVIFGIGLLMGAGQLCGAWLGTHLVITRGTRFIRVFFLLVTAATIVNLFLQRFF